MSVTEAADAPLLAAVARALQQVAQMARPEGVAPLPLAAPMQPPIRIAVAVSGGGDSVALLHLVHRLSLGDLAFGDLSLGNAVHQITPEAGSGAFAVHQITAKPPFPPFAVHAITVDHGLRPDSAAEAAGVAALSARLGLPHVTLPWAGPDPQGNLMDQARRARLSLMADWARAHEISHIFLGHTADDEAEGFVMNLARVAGLEGLSGMRPVWTEQGVQWRRPLLGIGRADLRAYLRRQGLAWVDDPSNDNDRFARVRARKALNILKDLGISADTLQGVVRNLACSQAALVQATHDIARRIETPQGHLALPHALFQDLPADLRRRLVIAAIRWMTGTAYPPRAAQVARMCESLLMGRAGTLAGLRFRLQNQMLILIREPRAVMGAVAPGQIWDHRWQVSGPFASGQTIAALGAHGLRQCPDWRAFAPRDSALVSPAIWQGDQLIAAPLVQKNADWAATQHPSFGMFVLRH